jgi:FkbM family methyltransferase
MALLSYLDRSRLSVRVDKIRFRLARRLGLLAQICPEHKAYLNYRDAHQGRSHSQIGQDLFVLHTLREKRAGYFVEFGATDGVSLSNTCLLEREFGWTGICAEPSQQWHPQLRTNRRCAVDERCVWSSSGASVRFTECAEGEFSTLSSFVDSDGWSVRRRQAREYEVPTLLLTDLLAEHRAPREIDYLSIDTEGSELEILSAHDFSRFRFRIITVEHNGVWERRNQIARLLRDQGYRRSMPAISRWDDWYVLRDA